MMFGSTSLILSVLVLCLPASTTPTVHINNGTLIGTSVQGVDTFLGIPFAEPPVGDLRLSIARPLNRSFGTRFATTTPNRCPQFLGTTQAPSIPPQGLVALLSKANPPSLASDSEDCLYVNVQGPAGTTDHAKLPVLVWIHGGGYEIGSASTPPSETGATIVARSVELGQPIIYVSLQYRLNGFGFLGGKEVQAAGVSNLGLRDQRMALQWVSL